MIFQRTLSPVLALLFLACTLELSSIAREVPITIISTTDLHGTILPTMDYEGNRDRGGIARVATKIAEIRKQTPNALLIDSGDTIQGTAVSFLDKGRVIVRLVNHLKYDAWTLGNHEFDWGTETLAACLARAEVPVLAGNLRPVSNEAKKQFGMVKPFVIKEVDGVKVAVVGLTTPGVPNWSRPHLIPGLEFEQSKEALGRIIPQVKAAGADVIVLAVHQGIRESGDDHANQLNSIVYGFPEIAAIAGGHTHRNWPEYKFARTDILYCQAAYWGTYLGRIDLVYDTEARKVVSRKSTTILMDSSIPPDPKILELSKNELATADKELSREIGVATADFTPAGAPRYETPLHNLIFESIAEALKARGVTVDAVVHGLLADRGMLHEGKLKVADVWDIVPYENTIGVVEITPAELKEILEENVHSRDRFRGIGGMHMTLKMSAPEGQRVVSLTDRDGKPLDETRRYKVAFNSYELASGGTRFSRLREIADRPASKLVEYDFQTREAVTQYIEKQKTISPKLYGWWDNKTAPKDSSHEPKKEKAAPAQSTPGTSSSTNQSLVIWGFCYHPAGKNAEPNGEWIVIANTGSRSIHLGGYSISDSEARGTFVFSRDLELKSKDKLVLAYDVEVFSRAAYPLAPNVKVIGYGADARGLRLGNSGDDMVLRDPDSHVIDEVWYAKQTHPRDITPETASRHAPTCRKGESLKRRDDAWTVNLSPSPGM